MDSTEGVALSMPLDDSGDRTDEDRGGFPLLERGYEGILHHSPPGSIAHESSLFFSASYEKALDD